MLLAYTWKTRVSSHQCNKSPIFGLFAIQFSNICSNLLLLQQKLVTVLTPRKTMKFPRVITFQSMGLSRYLSRRHHWVIQYCGLLLFLYLIYSYVATSNDGPNLHEDIPVFQGRKLKIAARSLKFSIKIFQREKIVQIPIHQQL